MLRKVPSFISFLAVLAVATPGLAQFASEGCSAEVVASCPACSTCDSQRVLDGIDKRAPVPLLPMMAEHQKRNMRDHLLAVEEITIALAVADFAAIEKSAGRIGYSEQIGQMCAHMGAAAPGFSQELISEMVVSPIIDSGKTSGARGIIRDISVRVAAEEVLRDAKETAEARAGELAAINHVAVAVSQSLDFRDILQSTCRELTAIFEVRNAGIGLLTPDKKNLEIVAFHAASPDEKSALGLVLPVEGNSSSMEVLEKQKTLVIQDAQNDPRTSSIADISRTRGTRSIMIVRNHSQIHGVHIGESLSFVQSALCTRDARFHFLQAKRTIICNLGLCHDGTVSIDVCHFLLFELKTKKKTWVKYENKKQTRVLIQLWFCFDRS